MRTVAIVGASPDRRKFGNKSVRAHAAAGWRVYPVHPKEASIEGLPAFANVAEIPVDQIERVSVYLPAAVTLKLLPVFQAKTVQELWLNPGADDDEVVAAAESLGFKVVCGCSIVDVGFRPSQFGDT